MKPEPNDVTKIRKAIGEARALVGMLTLPANERYGIDELLEQCDNIKLALMGQI